MHQVLSPKTFCMGQSALYFLCLVALCRILEGKIFPLPLSQQGQIANREHYLALCMFFLCFSLSFFFLHSLFFLPFILIFPSFFPSFHPFFLPPFHCSFPQFASLFLYIYLFLLSVSFSLTFSFFVFLPLLLSFPPSFFLVGWCGRGFTGSHWMCESKSLGVSIIVSSSVEDVLVKSPHMSLWNYLLVVLLFMSPSQLGFLPLLDYVFNSCHAQCPFLTFNKLNPGFQPGK